MCTSLECREQKKSGCRKHQNHLPTMTKGKMYLPINIQRFQEQPENKKISENQVCIFFEKLFNHSFSYFFICETNAMFCGCLVQINTKMFNLNKIEIGKYFIIYTYHKFNIETHCKFFIYLLLFYKHWPKTDDLIW